MCPLTDCIRTRQRVQQNIGYAWLYVATLAHAGDALLVQLRGVCARDGSQYIVGV